MDISRTMDAWRGGLDEVGLTQATFLAYLSPIAVIQYLVKIKQ